MTSNGSAYPADENRSALRDFVDSNALGGVLLGAAAVVALVWSNSPIASSYHALWASALPIDLAGLHLPQTLAAWVNDGLMAIFFLVVGLEIKRELLVGELDTGQRALLPIVAAVGGAVLPAVIFLAIVGPGSSAARGWGIPMATDIAFALGVLALVGRRAPIGLRIFVTALAIVDDLLAVLVIALFYSGNISLAALGASGALVGVALLLNRLGIRSLIPYAAVGVLLWLAVHESGIHSTIAGVLLALTIPGPTKGSRHNHSPLVRLEHRLNPLSGLVIVPVFALANAGVTVSGDLAAMVVDPIVVAIVAGLVVGKQVGITGAAWLMVRAGIAVLPLGVEWRHVYAASWICGIGFTMSLFIATLAYGGADSLPLAKVGILAASVLAGTVGYVLLRIRAHPDG